MALFDYRLVSHLPQELLKDKPDWSPFSILNTTRPEWLNHRADWLHILPHSGEGRDVKRYNATPTNLFSSHYDSEKEAESVSIFDPFLCELMYKWFSKKDMKILDPFAGGNVRGLVAETLGRNYVGIDLSSTQVTANNSSQKTFEGKFVDIQGTAEWVCGDSADILNEQSFIEKYGQFDMLFTCPPYYNLEQYTKNPADLSRMPTYADFLTKFGKILQSACRCLKDGTFCCIVISELRQSPQDMEKIQFYGLVPDTVHILRDLCGMKYYNEIILVNSLGSLPIRANKYFNQSRKIGRHHQNILVFYKGNIRDIEGKFGPLG